MGGVSGGHAKLKAYAESDDDDWGDLVITNAGSQRDDNILSDSNKAENVPSDSIRPSVQPLKTLQPDNDDDDFVDFDDYGEDELDLAARLNRKNTVDALVPNNIDNSAAEADMALNDDPFGDDDDDPFGDGFDDSDSDIGNIAHNSTGYLLNY